MWKNIWCFELTWLGTGDDINNDNRFTLPWEREKKKRRSKLREVFSQNQTMAYSDSSSSCVASALKITICFEIPASVYMQYVSNIYVIMLF